MVQPKLKFWGWGYEGDVLAPDEVRWLERMWAKQFRISQFDLTPPPTSEDIRLRPPRLTIPAALLGICTTEHYERLLHSYGSSFLDSVRTFARDFSHPPDVIAYPRHAQDVLALLDWCYDVGAAVIPFGGGTSVHLDVNIDTIKQLAIHAFLVVRNGGSRTGTFFDRVPPESARTQTHRNNEHTIGRIGGRMEGVARASSIFPSVPLPTYATYLLTVFLVHYA
jgi:hypothetical protein